MKKKFDLPIEEIPCKTIGTLGGGGRSVEKGPEREEDSASHHGPLRGVPASERGCSRSYPRQDRPQLAAQVPFWIPLLGARPDSPLAGCGWQYEDGRGALGKGWQRAYPRARIPMHMLGTGRHGREQGR